MINFLLLNLLLGLTGAKGRDRSIKLDDNSSLCDLTKFSDTIFVGDVITSRFPSEYGASTTTVTTIPTEFIKGRNDPVIEFLIQGGHFGETKLEIPGMPLIIMNSSYLFFLRGNSIAGFNKGIFIVYDEQIWRPLPNSNLTHPFWTGTTNSDNFIHYSVAEAKKQITDCL